MKREDVMNMRVGDLLGSKARFRHPVTNRGRAGTVAKIDGNYCVLRSGRDNVLTTIPWSSVRFLDKKEVKK